MQDLENNSCADSAGVIYSKPFGNRWAQITNQMNQKDNLPRSEFFASLTPQSHDYGTLPPLPPEPRNSPAALSERRRAIRRADFAREVIGWAIAAAAVAALGYILL